MEPDFWHRRWRENDIGFHRDDYHKHLTRFWSELNLPTETHVFVPLCGKSRDMIWLAEQGYKVIGVELSALAIEAFFSENNLSPTKQTCGAFAIWRSGPYELWCGDVFALPDTVWQKTSAVYDRASLVAFPPALQKKFADLLIAKLPQTAPIFLITLDYDPNEMDGPPFNVSNERISELFQATHNIKQMHSSPVLDDNPFLEKRGLSQLQESLNVLTRK